MEASMDLTPTNHGSTAMTMFNNTDPAALAAAASAEARIKMAYFLAVQKPRNPEDARVRIMTACRRPEFADRVEFRKPTGGTTICGPSVRFAESCIREWGNCLIETQIIYEDDRIRRSKVTALDLETNATYTKEIQVTKTVERRSKNGREGDVQGERVNSYGKTVYILRATDDELHQKEAALISKAVRNEGLRLIPSDIVDEGMRIARETLRNQDAEDPKAAMRKIIDSFHGIGVYPKSLAEYIGQDLESLAPHQIQELRGIFRSIRDGELTWSEVIAKPGDESREATVENMDDLRQKAAEAKERLKGKGNEVLTQAEVVQEGSAEAGRTEADADGAGDSAGGNHNPPDVQAGDPVPDEPDDWDLMASEDLLHACTRIADSTLAAKRSFNKLMKSSWDDPTLRTWAREWAPKVTKQLEEQKSKTAK